MSFSSKLKAELSKVSTHNNECCKLAELVGYLITNCNIVRTNDKFILRVITSSSSSVRRLYNAFKSLYGITPVTNIEKENEVKPEEKEVLYELIIENDEDLKKIFSNPIINIDVNIQIVIDDTERIKAKECCMKSFLRGVFLGSGSITEDRKSVV